MEIRILKNVSFVTTVYNEENSISSFLKSIFDQKILPSEVIIVDGGSEDDTVNLAIDFLIDEIKKIVDFLSEDRIYNFFIFLEEGFEKKKANLSNLIGLKSLHQKFGTALGRYNLRYPNKSSLTIDGNTLNANSSSVDSLNTDSLNTGNLNTNNLNTNIDSENSPPEVSGGKLIFLSELGFFTDEGLDKEGLNNLDNLNKVSDGKDLSFSKSSFTVKLIESRGANISKGRNVAIENASSEIVCVSDAGCILGEKWFLEITKFITCGEECAVGGFNYPICRSFLEKCLAMCIMPRKEEIIEKKFMPSSRNISFKKEVWRLIGGYPEELDWGEDMKFNFNLKANSFHIKFNPDAVVHWKMRENMKEIFKQFFRYSEGDAVGRMYLYRHLIRFFSFSFLVAIILVSVFVNPWVSLVLIPAVAGYIYKPYTRINYIWQKSGGDIKPVETTFLKIFSLFFTPFLLFYIDLAKICGYIYGCWHSLFIKTIS